MNASELIELLRKHPKAWKILNLCSQMVDDDHAIISPVGSRVRLWKRSDAYEVDDFRRWLVGACADYCDLQGWDTYIASNGHGAWTVDDTGEDRKIMAGGMKDRLHSMLAAIEAHASATDAASTS